MVLYRIMIHYLFAIAVHAFQLKCLMLIYMTFDDDFAGDLIESIKSIFISFGNCSQKCHNKYLYNHLTNEMVLVETSMMLTVKYVSILQIIILERKTFNGYKVVLIVFKQLNVAPRASI